MTKARTEDKKMADMVQIIEWDMLDKRKFYPLSMLSSFSVRCFLYPLTLIKTRIQIQQRDQVYRGMLDACRKIYQKEGIAGLYHGFWVSSIQVMSGVFYISTYEGVRHMLGPTHSPLFLAIAGGGCASVVGQTIIVPFDVISQHLMILGVTEPVHESAAQVKHINRMNPLGIKLENRSRLMISKDVTTAIYRRDGFMGFYRGYFASLCTYVPNSAMWWGFYHLYQKKLVEVLPSDMSHLLIQGMSGMLGGFTTTLLTNPLDIVRARLQVQGLDNMSVAFKILWVEERWGIFTKGLSARLVQSACFSFSIILGYETIKRLSVHEEHKEKVRW